MELTAEKFITAAELAELLRVTTVTIGRYARSGQLPGYRVGREWRFKESDVQRFIQARGTDATRKIEKR